MSAVKDTHVDDPLLVGRRIADMREELGLSQRQLAERAHGVSPAYISRIEVGARTPSWQALEALANGLEVDTHWLACGEEDPREQALELAAELLQACRRRRVFRWPSPEARLMSALEAALVDTMRRNDGARPA